MQWVWCYKSNTRHAPEFQVVAVLYVAQAFSFELGNVETILLTDADGGPGFNASELHSDTGVGGSCLECVAACTKGSPRRRPPAIAPDRTFQGSRIKGTEPHVILSLQN